MMIDSTSTYEQIKGGLRILGYEGNLLRENYEFTDVLSHDLSVKTIGLATFFQDPPSYYNACFGVVSANGKSGVPLISEYRSLGAPQIFEITNSGILRWKISSRAEPECLEKVELHQIFNFFEDHKQAWAPNTIRDVKSVIREKSDYQSDFFDLDYDLLPLLDREVQVKLDKLLTHIISSIIEKYPYIKEESPKLFRLIFRLIAAKIFSDRKDQGNWLQNDPRLVIKEVEKFYFREQPPEPALDDYNVQIDIWEAIKNTFHFQNLSVETLAYIYETSLMTPELRRKTSTHGTPSAIAEYIVRRLPIQNLGINERNIFEPFSGHAIFLVAALRRLRELLPSSMTISQRHQYFVDMLTGLEYEEFPREIARLLLMLADYPNPDSWHLYKGDVFRNNISNLLKANIILCNPPFEDFSDEEWMIYPNLTSKHKPIEILNKVLSSPPKLLGFVLPRIFISGNRYKQIRKILSSTYSSFDVLALPDNVFRYSSADTVLLIASGDNTGIIDLNIGQVLKKDLDKFYTDYRPSYAAHKKIIADPKIFDDSIWIPELNEIWDALSSLKKLGNNAEIHRGLEYNFSLKESLNRVVSDSPQPYFAKGLRTVSESLEPFFIRNIKYININPEDKRNNALRWNWRKPKIIVNASRNSAGHWRITAAEDYEGLYCSQYFDGIWLKDSMPLEVFSAILNSPLANAFISDHKITARENNINLMKQIPIPNFDEEQKERIVNLVTEYRQIRTRWFNNILDDANSQRECLRLLKLIDGEILKAYNLPKNLENKLLDYFTGHTRQAPVIFNGYYSESYQSHIKELQNQIKTIDLTKRGTPEERARHQIEVMNSMKDARMRANTTRIRED